MTLTVSQGKLLLKSFHPDQYTPHFSPARSNYTTENFTINTLSKLTYGLQCRHKGIVLSKPIKDYYIQSKSILLIAKGLMAYFGTRQHTEVFSKMTLFAHYFKKYEKPQCSLTTNTSCNWL